MECANPSINEVIKELSPATSRHVKRQTAGPLDKNSFKPIDRSSIAVATRSLQTPGVCRAWGVDSENWPPRGQFLPDLPIYSLAMEQKDVKRRTAAADSQPTFPKPDRLLASTNIMKSVRLAFLLSPLTPVVFWALLTNDFQVIGQASLIAYAGTIFFALPLYRLVVKRWRISLSSSLICSCVVGFLTWGATFIIYNRLYNDDLFTSSLTALLGFFLFILFGGISGIAFWLLHPAEHVRSTPA